MLRANVELQFEELITQPSSLPSGGGRGRDPTGVRETNLLKGMQDNTE